MQKKGDNSEAELVPGVNVLSIEIDVARALIAVNLANLIPVPPGTAEPPDFTGEPSEFGAFLDQHFPRSKFASLWSALDRLSSLRAKATVYEESVRVGRLLRAATVWIGGIARQRDECPQLRICPCGKMFTPGRKDKGTCSDTCADRVRKAKWRWSKTTPEQRDSYKRGKIKKEERKRKAG